MAHICKWLDLEDPIAKRQTSKFRRRITSIYTGPSLKKPENSVNFRQYNNYNDNVGQKMNLEALESVPSAHTLLGSPETCKLAVNGVPNRLQSVSSIKWKINSEFNS